MLLEKSCSKKCFSAICCMRWEVSPLESFAGLFPWLGMFTGGVGWYLRYRQIQKINRDLTFGDTLGPPTPAYPPIESSETSESALLAGGESPRGGDYRHPGNAILEMQKSLLIAKKSNSKALFIFSTFCTIALISLYTSYRLGQL